MCYTIKPIGKTWSVAKDICIDQGGSLATVPNAGKFLIVCAKSFSTVFSVVNTKLYAEATKVLATMQDFWIGLHDIGLPMGTFQWVNGDTWTKAATDPFWATGQPNFKADQDCVKVKKSGTGWDEVGCDNSFPYACQRPL